MGEIALTNKINVALISSIQHKPQQRFSELKPFLEFIIKHGCKNVLEIGAADGGLTFIFSCLFDKVVAVDIKHTATYEKENIIRVHPDMVNKLDLLYDLIFIDGDHSLEGVKKDFYIYKELLNENGIMALHDIKNTDIQRNNGCFVHEFIKEGKHFSQWKNTLIFNEFTDEWGGVYNPEMKNHGGIQIWFDKQEIKI